ncbi:unnamed protein product [Brassicogethes aeneus]|uniref:Mitochondrial 2-oxodicarboxylate carrier n=1 Tax=Brassicogethes aeneus TaxID=1431903 RepID=A0A9P0FKW4_BRAAE|nr:unnamed protein product [Brassicogethes aeneus]
MDIHKILKESCIQIGSGGSAGFVEVCIMHPLDLVKTRLQLQNVKDKYDSQKYYNGIVDCFKKMYRHEGFGSFWKGITPPIMAETPKRAVKFFTFEQYKKLLMFGSPHPTPLTYSLAGLGAGVTEAILVNPFEVVKVKLQANRGSGVQPSTWAVTKGILKAEGFAGLNKGVTATIGRNGVFNCVYFGFYHSVKDVIPAYKDPLPEFCRKICIGFVSGTLASLVNIPFDVVKSRIQGPQPIAGQVKYRGTIQSLALVYKEEGFRALYKGLLPKILRLGPGGAIMLVVNDYMQHFLAKKFE